MPWGADCTHGRLRYPISSFPIPSLLLPIFCWGFWTLRCACGVVVVVLATFVCARASPYCCTGAKAGRHCQPKGVMHAVVVKLLSVPASHERQMSSPLLPATAMNFVMAACSLRCVCAGKTTSINQNKGCRPHIMSDKRVVSNSKTNIVVQVLARPLSWT